MKFNKITVFFIVLFFAIFIVSTKVWADPNGNKGMFSFTDEQADKQAQEQIKEQEKQHTMTEVKSSDNYLSSLQVEGYTITPEFDKQTLEYTIKEEVKGKEINIKATTNNEKAKVTGNGIIKIEDNKSDYRVEVTAENSSVRTYIIKVNKSKEINENIEEKNEETQSIANNEIKAEETEINTNANIQPNEEKNNDNILLPIIIVIIVFLVVFLLKGKKKTTKRKH